MNRRNILMSAIVVIFIFAVSACADDDSNSECLGDEALCGDINCPDTISYESAEMLSDGDNCSIPDGIEPDASSLFNEMLLAFPGTYKNEENGETLTVKCDAEGTLWFPDDDTPCNCDGVYWYMPFIFTFESETVSGGLASYCSTLSVTDTSGLVFKEEFDPNDYGEVIGKMEYGENSTEWYLTLEDEDGNRVPWRKI